MSVSAVQSDAAITQAISRAAERAGVDFDYLLNTAARESGMDPRAQAPTSSAAGLFQFIEQTWLGMVKTHGAKHGMAAEAAQIERSDNGRFRVADDNIRQQILDLRFEPRAASAMAAEYAGEASRFLQARLGRAPNSGELYMAHFLGPQGAAELIGAAEKTPQASAAEQFPAAARANRAIFYEKGEPVSLAGLIGKLSKLGGGDASANAAASPAPPPAAFEGETAERYAESYVLPPARPGRVLSPSVIEALASLEAPERAKKKSG